jgi:hypothetical protein
MRMNIVPKENTTPGCHESFLPENHTMIEGEDPLIGNVGRPFTNGWTIPTTKVVVMGLQEMDL